MPQIMASGILTGAFVSGLGLTNLITVANTVIPDSVVRGLQLGMGFQLFKAAMKMLPNKGEVSWEYEHWLAWNGVCLCVCVYMYIFIYVHHTHARAHTHTHTHTH
jgi:MFS superfamily sulfate permease-like transporter